MSWLREVCPEIEEDGDLTTGWDLSNGIDGKLLFQGGMISFVFGGFEIGVRIGLYTRDL
jgi:hypothetical protein